MLFLIRDQGLFLDCAQGDVYAGPNHDLLFAVPLAGKQPGDLFQSKNRSGSRQMIKSFYSVPEVFPNGNKWVPGRLTGERVFSHTTTGLIISLCVGPAGKMAVWHGSRTVDMLSREGKLLWRSTVEGRDMRSGSWLYDDLLLAEMAYLKVEGLCVSDGSPRTRRLYSRLRRIDLIRNGQEWFAPVLRDGPERIFRLVKPDGRPGRTADFDVRFCPGWSGEVEIGRKVADAQCISTGDIALFRSYHGAPPFPTHRLRLVPGTDLANAATVDMCRDGFIAHDHDILVTSHYTEWRGRHGCAMEESWVEARRPGAPEEVLWSSARCMFIEWILGVGDLVIHPVTSMKKVGEPGPTYIYELVCRSIHTGDVNWRLPVNGSCTAVYVDGTLICAGGRRVTGIR